MQQYQNRLQAVLIVILIFVAYLPALRGDFIWDDDSHLTRNHLITAPDGLWRTWIITEAPLYLPLTFTTFWLEHKLWGFNPLGYHIVNISFHAITVLLLWRLLKYLKIPGAWWGAAAFGLHPIAVESVAWITELKNVQSGLFFISAIICYFRFDEGKGSKWYYLALALFLAALLSKTSTIMLPAVLLLCDWWRHRSWKWSTVIKLAPFFVFSALMAAVCIWYELHQVGARGPEWTLSFAEKLAGAGWIIWFYIGKLILPFKLTFIYPRWSIDPFNIASYFPIIAWLVILVILWRKRHSWGRPALLGFGFFTINLFPVMGFFNIYGMRYSYVADHWQYLPSIGIIVLAVSSLAYGSEHLNLFRAKLVGRLLMKSILALLVAALAILTWKQTHIYRDQEALWSDTVAKDPQSWIGHHNLGMVLLEQGKFEDAVRHFSRTARIKPSEASNAEVHIGVAFDGRGQPEKAIDRFTEALRLNPNNASAYSSLGIVLFRQGEIDRAIHHFKEALRVNPGYAPAHNNLGIALAQRGDTGQAVFHYSEAVKLKPAFAKAHYNLGNILTELDKLDEAIDHYQKAIAINPAYADAHYNLGVLLIRQGKRWEAEVHLTKAININPDLAKNLEPPGRK